MQTDPIDSPNHNRIGTTMVVLAWIAVVVVLTVAFSDFFEDSRGRIESSRVTEDGITEVVLKRDRSGHYRAAGALNGVPVNFLIDTGATSIAVSRSQARSMGLKELYPQQSVTAAGVVDGFATRIDEVRLGDLTAYNLSAYILPIEHTDHVLLGMAFLKHLELVQRDGTLTLRTLP